MTLLTWKEKAEVANRLARALIRFGFLVVLDETQKTLTVHGQVSDLAAAVHSRNSGFFTFFDAPALSLGAPCRKCFLMRIESTEQLRRVRHELMRLHCLAASRRTGDLPSMGCASALFRAGLARDLLGTR